MAAPDPALVNQANVYADAYGIPREIYQSLIAKESGWNPQAAASGSSAYGLTQLLQGTAQDLGVNRFTISGQLQGGADYLSQQYKRFGNWNDALAAYNQGPGGYTNSAGQNYANSVLQGATAIRNAATTVSPDGSANGVVGTGSSGGIGNFFSDFFGAHNRAPTAEEYAAANQSAGVQAANPKSGIDSITDFFQWFRERFGDFALILMGLVILAIALIASTKVRETVGKVATKGAFAAVS